MIQRGFQFSIFKILSWLKEPAFLIILICFSLAMFFESRAFTLGYIVAGVFIFLYAAKFKPAKKEVFLAVISAVLVGILLITFFKTDSSLGRIFIYKISFNMLKDHYLRGIGLNKFALIYSDYQIHYFKTGAYTTKEFLLADNTKHAFNDYLQFIIETGIKGLVFLGVFTAFIIQSIILSLKRNSQQPAILIIAISQLIALSVAALFMHVFEKLHFQCLFITGLLVIIYYAYFSKKGILKLLLIIAVSLACLHHGYYLKNYSYYKRLDNARELFTAGYINEALENCKVLYPYLKQDIIFLNQYATILIALNQFNEAEKIIESIIRKDNASIFYTQLGDCYLNNHKTDKAEAAYKRSIYMVPNRFTPRFKLFKLYFTTKQYNKAVKCGKEITNMPVKIPSLHIQTIKKEVLLTLRSLPSNTS